jgi:hypothetical protein
MGFSDDETTPNATPSKSKATLRAGTKRNRDSDLMLEEEMETSHDKPDNKRQRQETANVEQMTDREILLSIVRQTDAIKADTAEVNAKVDSWELKLSELEKKSNLQEEVIKRQEKRIMELESIVDSKIERLQKESKINNIIFQGLNPKTNPVSAAENFIYEKFSADPKQVRINSARFITGRKDSLSVLVSLGAPEDKRYLYSHVRNLKGMPYSVSDDLTDEQQHSRYILLQKRRELIDNEGARNVKIYNNSIRVGNDFYDLDKNDILHKRKSVNRPWPSASA